MRMYCVVARDSLVKMNGNRGKLAAQAGHAYLHAWWNAAHRFPMDAIAYRDDCLAMKVCVVVDSTDHLVELEKAYSSICGVSLVVDAGRTCFGGEETITCLGTGPIADEAIGDDLKALKVLI